MTKAHPDFSDITLAAGRIKGYIHKTPVLSSKTINQILETDIFFKCENFQKVGAFKFRGAINAVLSLPQDVLEKGVCTHSSGNHAQALSLAAKMANTPAYIVMPENAPRVKVNAVKGYGAEIIFCEPSLQAREKTLEKVQQRTGSVFIHPYDNSSVIAGQGTAAKELLEKITGLDIIMAPVGGGGLMSGTCISARHINPRIRIYGAEPGNANDAQQSFRQKRFIPSVNPDTLADGLLTSLSEKTFRILSEHLDDILTCSEESIIAAMRLIFERMKIIAEPSGAVPLACIIDNPDIFRGKRTGIIISGGNLDLSSLPF